jgi:hypothetical protein
MLTQKGEGRCCISNGFGFVQSLVQLKGTLPIFITAIGELHAGFLSPKEIGASYNKPSRGVPIGHGPHVPIDSENFLQKN